MGRFEVVDQSLICNSPCPSSAQVFKTGRASVSWTTRLRLRYWKGQLVLNRIGDAIGAIRCRLSLSAEATVGCWLLLLAVLLKAD